MKPGWLWESLVNEYGLDKQGMLKTVKRMDNIGVNAQIVRHKRGWHAPNPDGYKVKRSAKRCYARDGK